MYKSLVKYIISLLLFHFLSVNIYAQNWYTLKDDDVVVENGVITSCTYDFSLTDIIIPSTLDGQQVEQISIYNGAGVFKNKGITNLQLPETVTWINRYAFANNLLKKVTIPESVIFIHNYAFQNNSIDTLVLQNNLHSIAQGAFENNSIDSLFIPKSVHSISLDAFENNSISKLIFEDGSALEKIYDDAFKGNSIRDLILPDGVSYIGNSAFNSNQITNVEIPDSITFMGGGAFNNNMITQINGNTCEGFFYARKDNGKEDSVILVSYGGGVKDMDFIPENVLYIYWSAFNNCLLDSVVIPKNITKIGNAAFANNPLKKVQFEESSDLRMIQEYAFHSNTDLTFFILPTNSNPQFTEYKDQHNNSFNAGDTITEISNLYLAELGYYTITIDDVNFNEGVINDYTGNFKGYSDIIIPNSFNDIPVISIDEHSFRDNSLDTVILPSSIEYIGEWAFYNNNFEALNLPIPTLKEGYDSFNGWYDEKADTIINSPINNFYNSYIAKFTLTTYNINYLNVGTKNSLNNPSTYTVRNSISLEAPNDSIDRIFDGWFLDDLFQDTISTPAIEVGSTGDINIYAKWLLNTGINNNHNIKFNIYPNPASQFLNINYRGNSKVVFELYSITGSLILQKEIFNSEQVFFTDNISNGLYIVKLKKGNNIITKKIIINK